MNISESTTETENTRTPRYSEQLVLRVNELFYDAANEGYGDIHEEMQEQERERWRRLAQRFLISKRQTTLIDIGSGAGFVPNMVAPVMKSEDVVICSDLSGGMLEVARHNIEQKHLPPQFKFVKITGQIPYRLPFETASADVVTMNSVLHHIKETNEFLREIDRVLKPGGLLFIAHEPNRRFRSHHFLWRNYLTLRPLAYPKLAAMEWARKLGLAGALRGLFYRLRPDRGREAYALIDNINRKLMDEHLVDKPITLDEIGAITDIRDQEGFDPELLIPDYSVLHLETYNHILLVTIKHFNNPFIRRYEQWLRKKFPDAGATFFLVLGKGV